ncbi:MAG: TolC family protein [Methylobacter sp.]|jgi:cobalt-zinc-cadmium efflux system outer membrane protein|nr:TolC family protein [Methylobacter sp.]
MYSNYALPFGIALSVIIATSPVGANPTDKTMPLVHLEDQNKADRAPRSPSAEPTGSLILPQVLALTLTGNPELAAFSEEIRAREAAALQAGLLPNPVFGANAANFGNAAARGFDGDVVTLQLSQLIELGGKRTARIQVAQIGQEVASWDYEVQRVTVLARAAQAFIDVLGAQARTELVKHSLELAEKVVHTVSNQVKAGKVSPVEATRVEVALATAKTEMMRTERELETARRKLAAFWGSTVPKFSTVQGDLEAIQTLPLLASLTERLKQSPELALWTSELSRRQALLEEEKAKAVPDLTVTLGGSNYLHNQDYVMNVGVSMPLPVFDRNQGNIQQAERRRSKAENEQQATQVRIGTDLNAAYLNLDAIHAEVETYRSTILPGAESAYQAVQEGYRLGKFALLDVLDTQRTFFNAKGQYLRALAAYHQGVADIERLIGGALNEDSK